MSLRELFLIVQERTEVVVFCSGALMYITLLVICISARTDLDVVLV